MSETADSPELEQAPGVNPPGASTGRPAAAALNSDIPEALAYKVVLPDFEGPLDLLLYLCKSHEIDILEIPIAFITKKYLEYLDLMQTLSVEVAAEYLVMAATLAYLKSRELVPQPEAVEVVTEDGEEAGDPKEELIRRLLEYQKYKDAAEKLGNRPIEGKNVFGRGMAVEVQSGPEVLAEHSPWKLIECFAKLLEEAAPEHTHDVVIDRMSVAQRINQLIDKLEAGEGSFRFDSIIDFTAPMAELRHQVVVTLLAILELAKLKAIRVLQDPTSETFFVARASATSDDVLRAARRATTSSDGGDRHRRDVAEEDADAEAEVTPEAAAEPVADAAPEVAAAPESLPGTDAEAGVDVAVAAEAGDVLEAADAEEADVAAAEPRDGAPSTQEERREQREEEQEEEQEEEREVEAGRVAAIAAEEAFAAMESILTDAPSQAAVEAALEAFAPLPSPDEGSQGDESIAEGLQSVDREPEGSENVEPANSLAVNEDPDGKA